MSGAVMRFTIKASDGWFGGHGGMVSAVLHSDMADIASKSLDEERPIWLVDIASSSKGLWQNEDVENKPLPVAS